MGMTMASKLELYNQLVCRSMDPQKSGVTAPPPVLVANPVPPLPIPQAPSKEFVSFEIVPLDGVDGGKEWSHQCHKSKEVSSEVARLVRPFLLSCPSYA
jgi:hypothetical protein